MFLVCLSSQTTDLQLPFDWSILFTKQEAGTANPPEGGDAMSVLEVLALLNLLAVVIFGVLNIKK